MTTQQIENPAVYDAAYFIAKFEAIPEDKWTTGSFTFGPRHCVYGHCGKLAVMQETDESRALFQIAFEHRGHSVVDVNDGYAAQYPQETPKQRVLAWLRDAKKAGL